MQTTLNTPSPPPPLLEILNSTLMNLHLLSYGCLLKALLTQLMPAQLMTK